MFQRTANNFGAMDAMLPRNSVNAIGELAVDICGDANLALSFKFQSHELAPESELLSSKGSREGGKRQPPQGKGLRGLL